MKGQTVLTPADILLPANGVKPEWSVIACDQYTSQPDYWNRVERRVGRNPSTLQLIYPEVWLDQPDKSARIGRIHAQMNLLVESGYFSVYGNSYFYIERRLNSGKVRRGLIGKIDLEQYDYHPGVQCLVRPTEGTVESRLPPRMEIRRGAALELPHVMLLVDDPEKTILEPLGQQTGRMQELYNLELMENGGNLQGWLVDEQSHAKLDEALNQLAEKSGSLLFAVGDGNHSLATAKACFEQIKATQPKEIWEKHPARFALVELCNIHDEALEFEPIHRAVFQIDPEHLMNQMEQKVPMQQGEGGIPVELVWNGGRKLCHLAADRVPKAISMLQNFLDAYLKEFEGKIDYIHGGDVVEKICQEPERIGFLLPPMAKSELFPSVRENGPLPRKTFSMGEAWEKRYYLESRKIL